MATTIKKQERVEVEGVIVVSDEFGEVQFIVRRNPNNGGSVQFFKQTQLGFNEVEQVLKELVRPPEPKIPKTP